MMFASESQIVVCDDAAIDELAQTPAVFALHRRGAEPYLGRTSLLRRRLKRLVRIRGLRESVERIEYWPCSSGLESSLVLYETAKTLLPHTYLEFLRLKFPAYVKLLTSNPFPRTQITTKLTGTGISYGPFRSRASAEVFDRQMLDLFQIRRCQEDLVPSAEHPGCIYGEMAMCLRPCQEAVGAAEYATESARVADFLRTGGEVALQTATASRDRLSAEMEFEAAARQHKRVERIDEVLKSRDELARDVELQNGVAITRGPQADSVMLWPMMAGRWQPPSSFEVTGTHSVSMDQRLRELLGRTPAGHGNPLERQEHLALLARWYYSSWRDGIWIAFETLSRLPYRKLVSAISRTVHQSSAGASH